MTPRVSVIIPVFNSGLFLERTLASIQEEVDHEVILVNDGSTDAETVKILDSFRSKHRVIDQKNAGTAAARNRGAKESAAEFIIFIDSDDLFEKNFITQMVQLLENDPSIDFVYPDSVLFGSRVGYWKTAEYDPALLKYYQFFLVNSLIRRKMFEELGGFDPKFLFLEDREFWVRACLRGYTGKKVPALHFYRHHPTSKTAEVNRIAKMHIWEHKVHQKHRAHYGAKDFLNRRVLFYATYIRLFYLVPTALKNYLLRRQALTMLNNDPEIVHRFPEEVVRSFQQAGLLPIKAEK